MIKRQLYSGPFTLGEAASFIFQANGKDSTTWRLLACILHTAALSTNPDSCPLEVKPRPIKAIYEGWWLSSGRSSLAAQARGP